VLISPCAFLGVAPQTIGQALAGGPGAQAQPFGKSIV
jgi:hypothetical protein